jgi:hypothetical protein
MAAALAVSVNVLAPVVGFGLNDAVTPLGNPDVDRLTLPLNPFCGVTVIVLVPLVPCVIVKLAGDDESVKSGVGIGFTVSETAVLFLTLPETPLIVTLVVPVLAVLLAVSVNVLAPVVGFGLNDAVTPLGNPDVDRLTLPLNPFCAVTVIVLAPLVPCVTVKLPGDEDKVKYSAGVEPGQLFTKFVALIVPRPVAKSHPGVVP